MPELEALDLSHAYELSELTALAQSPLAPQLRRLKLSHMLLGPPEDSDWSAFLSLEELDLSRDLTGAEDIAGEFLVRLEASGLASSLRKLQLRGLGTGPRAARALVFGHFDSIEELSLRRGTWLEAELRELAERAALPALRSLDISEHPLSPAGLQAILRGPWSQNLQDLKLSACSGLTAGELAQQIQTSPARALRHLSLGQRPWTSEDLSVLLSAPALRSIHSLDLSSAELPSEAIRVLQEAELPNLQCLDLTDNLELAPADIEALSLAPGLPDLGELRFTDHRPREAVDFSEGIDRAFELQDDEGIFFGPPPFEGG
jgi:hypothetical protein